MSFSFLGNASTLLHQVIKNSICSPKEVNKWQLAARSSKVLGKPMKATARTGASLYATVRTELSIVYLFIWLAVSPSAQVTIIEANYRKEIYPLYRISSHNAATI